MKAELRHTPDRLAGRSGDENAAVRVRLVKSDTRAVGRIGWAAFIALWVVDDRRRVATAHTLSVNVPAAVHFHRVSDGGAVGRDRRRRFLAGGFRDAREVPPLRFIRRGAPTGDPP